MEQNLNIDMKNARKNKNKIARLVGNLDKIPYYSAVSRYLEHSTSEFARDYFPDLNPYGFEYLSRPGFEIELIRYSDGERDLSCIGVGVSVIYDIGLKKIIRAPSLKHDGHLFPLIYDINCRNYHESIEDYIDYFEKIVDIIGVLGKK